MLHLVYFGAASSLGDDKCLRVILEQDSWRFIGTKMHIGLHTKTPRDYTLRVSELKDNQILPPELRARFNLFETVFKTSEDASTIS